MSYQEILDLIHSIKEQARKKNLSRKEVLIQLDHLGPSFIALFLVLPFMQPFPVGPISVIGGLAFSLIGFNIYQNKRKLILPQKIIRITFSPSNWERLFNVCTLILKLTNKITKRRLLFFFNNARFTKKIEGAILIISGLLMAIPFGILPFNNFFPGLAILFIVLAQFKHDGLFVLLSMFWVLFTLIYFALFFYGIYFLGNHFMQSFQF
jgi:hypothetical protein